MHTHTHTHRSLLYLHAAERTIIDSSHSSSSGLRGYLGEGRFEPVDAPTGNDTGDLGGTVPHQSSRNRSTSPRKRTRESKQSKHTSSRDRDDSPVPATSGLLAHTGSLGNLCRGPPPADPREWDPSLLRAEGNMCGPHREKDAMSSSVRGKKKKKKHDAG